NDTATTEIYTLSIVSCQGAGPLWAMHLGKRRWIVQIRPGENDSSGVNAQLVREQHVDLSGGPNVGFLHHERDLARRCGGSPWKLVVHLSLEVFEASLGVFDTFVGQLPLDVVDERA